MFSIFFYIVLVVLKAQFTIYISSKIRFVKQLKSEDKLNQLLQMLLKPINEQDHLTALGNTSDIK